MATRSPRARHRRHVVEVLANAKRTIAHLQGWWDVTGKVYLPADDRKPGENAYLRDRRADEYPETDPTYWASTTAQIDTLIADLTELRRYTYIQYTETGRAS